MKKIFSKVSSNSGVNQVDLGGIFKHINGFSVVNLENNSYQFESEGDEVGILILDGRCDLIIENNKYENLGRRTDVFSGMPTAAYIPIDSRFSIMGEKASMLICRSECNIKTEPLVIYPEMVKVMEVGRDNWKREVRMILGPDSPSVNLLLGETINPPGNWSGTPPHKHENDLYPKESIHEELYYFKTDKPQGWGIERLYSYENKMNDLIYLDENTVTFMPSGYHQIVAGPGYTLYYSFFLSGKGKKLVGYEDPAHNWIKQ